MIPIDRILPDPDQPRKFFDEAEELRIAESIQRHGLIQPILVRPIKHPAHDYRIVYGERRYRAHKRLGLRTIKAIVREMEDSEARDLQLLENIQRSDLSDIELAWEFQRRIKEGHTHQQIAEVIGRNRSYVTQRLSLLRLSDSDQQRMLRSELSFSQARVLVSVKDPEERRRISKNMNKDVTVKNLQREIRGESVNNVTRVTSKSHVSVENLAVYKLLSEEDGGLKTVVSRSQLIVAYLEDLKLLR
jgi:ParB family chromosome partitioning protein